MSKPEPAIEFENVTIRYAQSAAVIECSFTVHAGERVALLGLNGSGKTSLLLAAAGLIGFEGSIRICGIPVNRSTHSTIRKSIGFLFSIPDDQLLFPKVIDDVAFGLIRNGFPADQALERALDTLATLDAENLAESSPYQLSQGQRMRVALAGILVTSPPVLLLDEPSASLDVPERKILAAHFNSLPSAMLIATHDVEFAKRVCSRFVLLDEGRATVDSSDCSNIPRTWHW